MPTTPDDQRPPLAIAMQWASQIISMALTIVLPAVAGIYADQWLGTKPWLVIAGAMVGSLLGLMQLLAMVSRLNSAGKQDTKRKRSE